MLETAPLGAPSRKRRERSEPALLITIYIDESGSWRLVLLPRSEARRPVQEPVRLKLPVNVGPAAGLLSLFAIAARQTSRTEEAHKKRTFAFSGRLDYVVESSMRAPRD